MRIEESTKASITNPAAVPMVIKLNFDSITASSFDDLNAKKDQYQKIIKQLKSNKVLRQALNDSESKQHVINALNAMIKELSQSK